MSSTRVVVTGLGVVSPLGVGVKRNWRRLLDNYCGIVTLNEPEYNAIPSRVVARVPINTGSTSDEGALNFADHFKRMSDLKSMSLASAYALVAAHEALEQSQVNET